MHAKRLEPKPIAWQYNHLPPIFKQLIFKQAESLKHYDEHLKSIIYTYYYAMSTKKNKLVNGTRKYNSGQRD
jgi:hypothetical protein